MTLQEFNNINWHRGNVAKLNNGKEYLVKGIKGHGRYLLLYSHEYDKNFIANYDIVECRTSDYEEPEEVYLEMKRKKQAEAEARRQAEKQERLRAKAELKQKHIEEQERIHREAVARKAAEKIRRQKEREAKKIIAKQSKTDAKSVAKVGNDSQPKVADAPKAVKTETAVPASDTPKKRVRQRIRITTATPIREKVEYLKKK